MTAVLDRILYRALPFAIALGFLLLLRLSGTGVAGAGAQSTTIALGFLLLGAFICGKVALHLRLPRITGFLLVGILVGPGVSGLLTRDMLVGADAVEGIAVALIALTAGGEIRIGWVRQQLGRLTAITFSGLALACVGTMALILAIRQPFPFVPADDFADAVVIAFLFGTLAAANSPTVAIAVIADTRSEGPMTRTVLGVTILKDVCVIVLFAVALTLARDVLGEGGGEPLGITLGRELGGSVVAGILAGIGISFFLRYVGRDTPVFILAVSFAIWQVASSLHLETLLIALTAGFWVENFSRERGEVLIHGIERVSLPVYALFFAVEGAKVDLGALASLWPFALLLSAVRAVLVWAGTWMGARLSRAELVVQKYAWLGFISQAGVTLALSAIVARAFPTWGADVQALVIAMIAIHELVGPIGFQWGLRRAGESGAAPPRASEPRTGAGARG